LLLPKTLRTPTSFARLTAWAVERLIKFTQAINRMNAAMSHNTLSRLIADGFIAVIAYLRIVMHGA
jgi:hypothetical protein